MNEKVKNKLKGYMIVLAFPLLMVILMEIICYLNTGYHLIISKVDLSSFVKNVFILTCTGLALSLGMRSGRMDFSLGAQRLIACLIGCNVAISLGLSGPMVLLFAILFGMLAGLVSGIIFITFRIPSMVCGLGVALVFESIAFLYTDGEGLQFFGNAKLNILSSTAFVIGICMAAIIVITILYSFTPFGYHYQAIRSNERIARESGIKVFGNVIICYLLGGGLMGISGVLDTVYKGAMNASTGMSSVAVAFYAIVNVIIAMYYSRYVSFPIAVLAVTIGLQSMNSCITALGINSQGASAIQMFFLLGFAFVTYLIGESQHKKAEAQEN